MSWSDLPDVREVFKLLRSGRNVAMEDGRPFRALAGNETEFRELFSALGFDLIRHPRDFFYFKADSRYSPTGAKVAVFFFILVEWIADRGEAVEETVFNQSFALSDLPHLIRDRYRAYMAEAGVDGEDGLQNVLRSMVRMGFLRMEDGSAIRFRTPAYRLMDLCTDVLRESGEGPE